MELRLLLLLIVWTIPEFVVTDNNFTFTYNMAMLCKEYISRHGYVYETFYRVDAEDRQTAKSDLSIIYEMHIAILGSSNGHILLSTVPKPDTSDPVYEIVVGGGANRFTELRGNLKRNARASAKTHGILSPIEFRAFYIKITEDGLIEFGKEGEVLPILSYQDMDPITVRYFSFASWNGVEAKFLYDCPIPTANGTEVTPDSEAVEPTMSNSDKLRRTLLLGRDPAISPQNVVNLTIGVRVRSVSYDAFESKLTTGLSILRTWTDNSLAWNPDKFNGTDSITFRQGQIWCPALSVFNADGVNMLEDKNPEPIVVLNGGEVLLPMKTTVQTWCYDYDNVITKWPRDEYNCAIVIEPWEVHDQIMLRRLASTRSLEMAIIFKMDKLTVNDWEVHNTQKIINSTSWNTMYSYKDNYTRKSDRFLIEVNIKRRATAYNIVLYTPLLCLATFLLLSFWSDPLTMRRIWFYAGCAVVICMGLCYIDILVPSHTVPSILILYVVVFYGVLLALLINVTLMTSAIKNLCKTNFVQALLMSQCFRTLFCLPPLKVCHIYESVNESNDSAVEEGPRNGNVEEMESDKNEYSETKEIAEAIDKIMFVAYSLVFAILLAMHF